MNQTELNNLAYTIAGNTPLVFHFYGEGCATYQTCKPVEYNEDVRNYQFTFVINESESFIPADTLSGYLKDHKLVCVDLLGDGVSNVARLNHGY